jgi:hypothetical protein
MKQVEFVFIGNSGSLSFRDYSHPSDYNSYGFLYINNDFSELAIIVHKLVESGSVNSSFRWNPEDGLLISGPATNRKEVLIISTN